MAAAMDESGQQLPTRMVRGGAGGGPRYERLGRVRLKVGTLYGVLDRLADQGLVELDHEEVQQGRLRRYYRLTEPGSRALAAEAERQAANARAAARRLRVRQAAHARGGA